MCVLFAQSCVTVCDARLLSPWDCLGKNIGVGSHSLLQGIFPTQGLNPGLLHSRQILYHLSHQGIPCISHYSIVQSYIFREISYMRVQGHLVEDYVGIRRPGFSVSSLLVSQEILGKLLSFWIFLRPREVCILEIWNLTVNSYNGTPLFPSSLL